MASVDTCVMTMVKFLPTVMLLPGDMFLPGVSVCLCSDDVPAHNDNLSSNTDNTSTHSDYVTTLGQAL